MPESKKKKEDDKKKKEREKLVSDSEISVRNGVINHIGKWLHGHKCSAWGVSFEMMCLIIKLVSVWYLTTVTAVFQEEESRLQAEEEMGLKATFEGSNQLNIPVKALSGRWVAQLIEALGAFLIH